MADVLAGAGLGLAVAAMTGMMMAGAWAAIYSASRVADAVEEATGNDGWGVVAGVATLIVTICVAAGVAWGAAP